MDENIKKETLEVLDKLAKKEKKKSKLTGPTIQDALK